MTTIQFRLTAAVVFALGVSVPSFAQAPTPPTPPPVPRPATALSGGNPAYPTWETALGYQWLHAPDANFPLGFNFDGARYFGRSLGIAAEVGWARRSEDDVSINAFNFAAGPRWAGPRSGKAWPYAQVLVGGLYAHATDSSSGQDVSDSKTKFMIQPGAGIGVIAGDGWGIFGQVDYRRVFLDEDTDGSSGENEFRIVVGVRVLLD